MEVVIPISSGVKTVVPKAEERPKKLRRTASRNPIVVQDSDSEDEIKEEVKPDKKRKRDVPAQANGSKAKVAKGKRKATSDDEDFDAGDAWSVSEAESEAAASESDDDAVEDELSEEEKPKGKGKGKAPAKPAKKSKAATKSKRPPMKKRKTEEDSPEDSDSPEAQKKQINQKKSRVELDPWGLKSEKVQNDWKQMLSPPLEAFHFKRVVVDEYTYLDGKAHSLITHFKADFRWVLSGTPPIHDFAAVKTIAVFLGIHLGIDDDSIGSSSLAKKRRKERTGAYMRSLCFTTRRLTVVF